MRTWDYWAKGILTTMALAGMAAAQDPALPANPPVTTSEPTASSTPASPSANSSPAAPRTGLYTGVTKLNAAADNTVDDYTRRPTLINGRQYFAGWGGTDLMSGAFAFQGNGFDWFGSASGGAAPDEVRAGLARPGSWGGGVVLSLAKSSYETPAGDNKVVLESDGLGLFGDVSMGSSDLYGQVAVYTGFDALGAGADHYVKVGSIEQKNTVLNLMGGWKKDATTEGTHAVNIEGAFNMSLKRNESVPTDSLTFMDLDLWFYHGYILKAAPGYSVFLGSNTEFLFHMEDWNATPETRSHYRVAVMPNIAFQKTLAWGFEAFAGGSVTVSWDMYDNSVEDGVVPAPAGATAGNTLLTGGADVALGLRWVKDNLAVEGSLRDALIANGPHFIGGNAAPGMFAQIGVTLGI